MAREFAPEDEAAIKELGELQDAVVPNTFHTTQLADFARQFPAATLWALPAIVRRITDAPHELLERWPDAWRADLDAVLFDAGFRFREWIVFHRASATLLLTDLGFELPCPKTPVGRVLGRLNDIGRHFGPSRLERTLIRLGNTARAPANRRRAAMVYRTHLVRTRPDR